MSNKHFYNLGSAKTQKKYPGGNLTHITADEVSSLDKISFALLKLNKGSCHEAIWHPNAHKIGYCQSGSGLVTILSPGSHDTFTIKEGDVFFVPEGFIHYIANIGDNETVIAFAYSHQRPDVMTVSRAIQTLPESVFAATFKTTPAFFEGMKKSNKDNFIYTVSIEKPSSYISSHYKFSIDSSNNVINTKGGYLKASTKPNLPVLQDLGIFTFGLNPKGVVEPHWHPNAGELIYIAKGNARITVLAPDGTLDVAEVSAGGGGFAPASHFHSIENIGKEDVLVVAFFSNADPNYIGISEALSVLPRELLAATFNVAPDYFKAFQPSESPIVICAG